uniref:Putative secreted protein n=1 Tax=Ixodes ricinus TaxID=34613 RepID=A0A6B0U6E7_IXORI
MFLKIVSLIFSEWLSAAQNANQQCLSHNPHVLDIVIICANHVTCVSNGRAVARRNRAKNFEFILLCNSISKQQTTINGVIVFEAISRSKVKVRRVDLPLE